MIGINFQVSKQESLPLGFWLPPFHRHEDGVNLRERLIPWSCADCASIRRRKSVITASLFATCARKISRSWPHRPFVVPGPPVAHHPNESQTRVDVADSGNPVAMDSQRGGQQNTGGKEQRDVVPIQLGLPVAVALRERKSPLTLTRGGD